jgi:membrane-associated protease RseP (regulator of RpoE activity)
MMAGPLTHIPMGLIWLLLQIATTGGHVSLHLYKFGLSTLWIDVSGSLLTLNIILFIINLAPCYPLDGGRIFASCLRLRGLDADSAARIICYVNFPLGATLILMACLLFFFNFSVSPCFD